MFSSTDRLDFEIHRHGTIPWTYALLDQRQLEIAEQIRRGGPGKILLSEVAPVITLGPRTPQADLLMSEQDLKKNGIQLYRTNRGGLATYHGPGQWVLFLVDRLERLTGDNRGVRKVIDLLLGIAKMAAAEMDVEAEIGAGDRLGAWSKRGKFAAVGIKVENGVVLHGLSVNGFKSPESFLGLRPCGLDLPVDYLLPNSDSTPFEKLGERLVSIAQRPANQS